ncbi:MAG: stalk domain-containing protein [Defluviitaleaceae bacterium]|nr:stalk domain-containing protein [Defluviitaleaceae bacterium]
MAIKKEMQKFIALALSLLMVFGVVPVSAGVYGYENGYGNAYTEQGYYIEDGDHTQGDYTKESTYPPKQDNYGQTEEQVLPSDQCCPPPQGDYSLAPVIQSGFAGIIAASISSEVFLAWNYTNPTASNVYNWPATSGATAALTTLEFFYANGEVAELGHANRAAVNAPGVAAGWFPAGDGAINANNAGGWRFTLSTLGQENITFSAQQGSSNNGPRDFGLAYRLNTTGSWTSFGPGWANTILVSDGPGFGMTNTFENVQLPSTTFNQPFVQIKVYVASRARRSDGVLSLAPNGGNTSINNVVFSGEAIEIPYTVAGVVVSPRTAEVAVGTTQPFQGNAIVVGTTGSALSTTVTWSVTGNEASGTNINSNTGLLTVAANETADTLTVRATSVATTSMYATAEVTVYAPDEAVFLAWNHTSATFTAGALYLRATHGAARDTSMLEFFYAGGLRATLGTGNMINVPNNASGWFPTPVEATTANNSAGFQITLSTLGHSNITFSAQQSSSNNGPAEFGLAYRLGTTGPWRDIGVRELVFNEHPDGRGDTFVDVPLPATVNNQATVQIKVFIASNLRRSDHAPDLPVAGGNTSINNIVFSSHDTPPAPAVLGVVVDPRFEVVEPGQTQQFTADVVTVGGVTNTAVTWLLDGGVTGTTLSDTGLLTIAADETYCTLFITATSVHDNTVYGWATVLTEEPGLPPLEMDFEIAFLLDASRVLYDCGGFRLHYRELLLGGAGTAATGGLPGRERILTIQWMDTPDQVFSQYGWINRVRHRDWQPNPFQVTYRNRIPLVGPVSEESIQAAMDIAYSQGFGSGWDFEVDWSYDSAVLSLTHSPAQLSYARIGDNRGPVTDIITNPLPTEEFARELLATYIPTALINAVNISSLEWYLENLERVVAHGPVIYRRYDNRSPIGWSTPDNIGLTIEVMPLRTECGTGIEYIVEASVSFEDATVEEVYAVRAELQELLEYLDILEPRSGLRTSTVLARYARTCECDANACRRPGTGCGLANCTCTPVAGHVPDNGAGAGPVVTPPPTAVTPDDEPAPPPPTEEENHEDVLDQLDELGEDDEPVIVITLPEGVDDVLLSAETIEILVEAEAALDIVSGTVTVTISSDFLDALLEDESSSFIVRIAETVHDDDGEEPGDDDVQVFVTAEITIIRDGEEVESVGIPYTITVDMSGFDIEDLNPARIVLLIDGIPVGGTFDPETGQFSIDTVLYTGLLEIVYVPNLRRVSMALDSPIIVDAVYGTITNMGALPDNADGRAMIPARFVAESLGADVQWDTHNHRAIIVLNGQELILAPGQMMPGMDVPAFIEDGRMMLPLRFVAEFFGATVIFNDDTREIEIIL